MEWYWRIPKDEIAQGPFASPEAAVADAQVDHAGEKVAVGIPRWPDPGDAAAAVADFSDLLETMDDYAHDNGYYNAGEELFTTTRRREAEDDLRAVTRAWASRWVKASVWSTSEDEEIVLVPPQTPDSEV